MVFFYEKTYSPPPWGVPLCLLGTPSGTLVGFKEGHLLLIDPITTKKKRDYKRFMEHEIVFMKLHGQNAYVVDSMGYVKKRKGTILNSNIQINIIKP